MNGFTKIYQEIQEKIEKDIFQSMHSSAGTTIVSTTNNDSISSEKLLKLYEELLKNKTEVIMSPLVPKNEIMIVDCEELRKTYPNMTARGKRIFCNEETYQKLK